MVMLSVRNIMKLKLLKIYTIYMFKSFHLLNKQYHYFFTYMVFYYLNNFFFNNNFFKNFSSLYYGLTNTKYSN